MKETQAREKRDGERLKRSKIAYRPIAASFGVNLVLFALKMWAGLVSGSVAIVADAWHTVSDSLSTMVVFAGFKLTGKKPDKEHPYGHERAEKISGIIVGVILFFIGANFLIVSFQRLLTAASARFGAEAVWVLVFSLIAKEAAARYSISTGKKIKSDSLVGDGWHHRSDAASSALILGGILIGRRWWWIDGALGVVIAAMLFRAAWGLLKKTSSSMLGESLSDESRKKLKELVKKEIPGAGDAHHFHLHSYGSHRELSFHISLPGHISLKEAHEKAARLEETVREETGFEPTVHVDHEEVSAEKNKF